MSYDLNGLGLFEVTLQLFRTGPFIIDVTTSDGSAATLEDGTAATLNFGPSLPAFVVLVLVIVVGQLSIVATIRVILELDLVAPVAVRA